MSAQLEVLERLVSLDDAMRLGLESRGYHILGKVGEGQTSHATRVEIRGEGLTRTAIAKTPKRIIDSNSVRTLANITSKDRSQHEASILSGIRHPHVIGVYDAFVIDGRTVIVEEDYDAISLEDLVLMNGPIKDARKFEEIFRGVISGLKNMYDSHRLLHRDIKPSNILVGKGTSHAKITDLQNAGRRNEMATSPLPTWGGTAYTTPKLLNPVLEGNPINADFQSEIYALGATMYFALTGEHLFDRELTTGESNHKIIIDGKEMSVILKENDEIIESIDFKKHDKYVCKKLRKVPRKLRELLKDCLLVEEFRGSPNYYNIEEKFNDATRKSWINWGPVKRNTPLFAGVAGGIIGLMVGGYWINYLNKTSPPIRPSISELIGSTDFTQADIEYLQHEIDEEAIDSLESHFKDIKERLTSVEKEEQKILGEDNIHLLRATQVARMSKRLSTSMILSIMMEDQEKVEEHYGDKRFFPGGVPKKFATEFSGTRWTGTYHGMPESDFSDNQKMYYGIQYLKRCIGTPDTPIVDVFANYFVPANQIDHAQWATLSGDYFPTATIQEDSTIKRKLGYGYALHDIEKNLIERAMALYIITDNNGEIHTSLINSDGSIDREALNLPPKEKAQSLPGWGEP